MKVLRRYSTMSTQSSRGCPFNCECSDLIEIEGRPPRTEDAPQVLGNRFAYVASWAP
jgi:hypothetical protein